MKLSTRLFYRRNLDLHILPVFGSKKLVDVRLDDLQAFTASKGRVGAAASTINGLITTLMSVFKYAVRAGYLRENPASYIRRPRKKHQEMNFLTIEEVRLFLKHVNEDRYALFLMAISTGLRRGELLATKWDNLDWRKGCYNVSETLSMPRQKGGPIFTGPKSEESQKSVDLTPRMLRVLKEHRKKQAKLKLRAGPNYNDYDLIFCQPDGKPIDPDNLVRRNFHKVLEAAGLRQIRFHDLRHKCASLLIAQGESPKYIQRQLRHASITTTLNTYGHLMPEVRRAAAERMDATLFWGSLGFVRRLLEKTAA